jgi:hypothetical protein
VPPPFLGKISNFGPRKVGLKTISRLRGEALYVKAGPSQQLFSWSQVHLVSFLGSWYFKSFLVIGPFLAREMSNFGPRKAGLTLKISSRPQEENLCVKAGPSQQLFSWSQRGSVGF